MFITAVCLIFLLKLKWPKNKNVYDFVMGYRKYSAFMISLKPLVDSILILTDKTSRITMEMKTDSLRPVEKSSSIIFSSREFTRETHQRMCTT